MADIRKTVTITPRLQELVLVFRVLFLENQVDADFGDGLSILAQFGFERAMKAESAEELLKIVEERIPLDESTRARIRNSFLQWQKAHTSILGEKEEAQLGTPLKSRSPKEVSKERNKEMKIERYCINCGKIRLMVPKEVRQGKKGRRYLYGKCSNCNAVLTSNKLEDIALFEKARHSSR